MNHIHCIVIMIYRYTLLCYYDINHVIIIYISTTISIYHNDNDHHIGILISLLILYGYHIGIY